MDFLREINIPRYTNLTVLIFYVLIRSIGVQNLQVQLFVPDVHLKIILLGL
jgi:hypothetical protein